jgi:hypothetical protein
MNQDDQKSILGRWNNDADDLSMVLNSRPTVMTDGVLFHLFDKDPILFQ